MEQTSIYTDDNNASNNINHNNSNASHSQNVRHIPIYVEGRDEPICNTFTRSRNSSEGVPMNPAPTINEIPKSSSIFDRVKNFPVRFGQENDLRRSSSRGPSPGRQIPVDHLNYQQQQQHNQHHHHQQSPQPQQQPQHHHHHQQFPSQDSYNKHGNINVVPVNQDTVDSPFKPETPNKAPIENSIEKIQKIQKDVLELMNRVEHFNGSRKDREYTYLDEMLTQNLLKLDVIDTEGNDNIKNARRAAIKCINKCIEVLEAKAENGTTGKSSSSGEMNMNEAGNNQNISNKFSSQTSTAV